MLVLAVKPGDRVRSGQLVARVDERETQAAVQRSEAGVAPAEAATRIRSRYLKGMEDEQIDLLPDPSYVR